MNKGRLFLGVERELPTWLGNTHFMCYSYVEGLFDISTVSLVYV